MSNIQVNRLHETDIEQASQLLHYVIEDTFIKNGLGDLQDEIKKEAAEKREYLQSDINTNGQQHFFLVAKDEDEVVGTIESSPSDEFISNCTNGELKDITKIGTIYIHPSYQKRGIGSKLLEAMISELKHKNVHQFCMDSGFVSSQKIWTKKFGEPTYYLKDFWSEGGDHMIWLVKI